jgi:hypothetical protein
MRTLARSSLLLLAFASAVAAPSLTILYPLDGTLFPPEIAAPTFLWHDSSDATTWTIDIAFSDGRPALHARSDGEPPPLGEIDPRAVAPTNRPPEPIRAHSWLPSPELWAAIKQRSVAHAAIVTIASPAAQAHISIQTSSDPVGAPIFYRDVPLMPSELKKGVIKPLEPANIPLIAWRLRDVAEPRGHLVLEGVHSCTNCHSFSRDGRTLGMDVDGPENDKGTYAIVNLAPHTNVRTEDVITWNSFPGKLPGTSTIGFLSQISPDGRYVVSTVNEQVYVQNFTDYRFLQVFYPTRGILAIYNRATKTFAPLPGASDPRYVQSDAVWSPDGQYLVFARATARDAYPEQPMQYDLHRVPFNNGKGGRAEPIAGASQNGFSNTFPKVSPDGRWIVYTRCKNGQLLRPDSELFIVPASGGAPRRMNCNTPLMNSWHSFSPNGRWMVFASKSRSPYTQMFLTHIDEAGNDTPAVLIENATAANRAINLPEFVNLKRGDLQTLEIPAAEFYRLFDSALALAGAGRPNEAILEWRRALKLDPSNAKARTNLGIALANAGATAEALAEFQRAVDSNPNNTEAQNNLGVALLQQERFQEAIAHFRKGKLRHNLLVALDHAARHEITQHRGNEAVALAREAMEMTAGKDPAILETLSAAYAAAGRLEEAAATARRAQTLK